MDANVQKQDEFAKISFGEKVAYGLGDFAQNLVFGTVGGFLLFYMTNINAISAAAGATIFLVVRWINVFWDPFVGTIVDKSSPKNGKYRPYLIWFGIPLTILAAMLFLPLDFAKGNVIYATVSYMATAMVYSFVNIPYGSISASLTRDNDEIASLTTVRMTLANTANLLVYTLFPLFVQLASPNAKLTDTGLFGLKLKLGNYGIASAQTAWFKVYGVYMVLGFIALMITYFGIKERVVPTAEESHSVKFSDLFKEFASNKALQILGLFFLVAFTFMFFGNTVWPYFMQTSIGHQEWMASIGLIGSIPGIFLVFLWPKLRDVLGKKGFFFTFIGIFIVGQLILWYWTKTPDNIAVGYVGRFLQQWGLTSATGFMWSMVPEVVTYGEYTSKKRVAGIINAIMGLFFKIGLALGGILPGFILAATHFNGQAKVQMTSALTGIEISMIWAPIALSIVAGLIMAIYPLTDAKVKEMNEELAASHEA
ncbi:MFS transporter [Weissella diestrammenae]|uniref:MFS transporter n=1 Tax=Weissella diestrammenae TaxID=1162633 RepID=A0A7G9T752_9LACO|nr:MFS transporter [Weissella diestrammenae]MCM0582472.1 MFS transporter [Weissella diestrammenae]QNN75927.1 MFS transporter [Weissella diestrammenae]